MMLSRTERRYRRILNVAWAACLLIGPYLVFELGNYHGQVNAYREEHAQELYHREQEAQAHQDAGYGYYLLKPPQLSELESSQEIYGILAFVWIFVAVGIWKAREKAQHASWCATRWGQNASCDCGGQWRKDNLQS
jgi:hypothetical protein